jgi:hypothetical protein
MPIHVVLITQSTRGRNTSTRTTTTLEQHEVLADEEQVPRASDDDILFDDVVESEATVENSIHEVSESARASYKAIILRLYSSKYNRRVIKQYLQAQHFWRKHRLDDLLSLVHYHGTQGDCFSVTRTRNQRCSSTQSAKDAFLFSITQRQRNFLSIQLSLIRVLKLKGL